MNPGRRLVLALLLLAGAALLATAWLSRKSFRVVPVQETVGLHGEALVNQTLLLQKWLEAGGRPATLAGGIFRTAALPEGATVIILNLSQPISAAETAALLAWVRRGGHLVTDGTAAPFNDEQGLANLHRALGVTLRNLRPQVQGEDQKRVGEDTFRPAETPYRVRRSAGWRLLPQRPEDWTDRIGHDLDGHRAEVLLARAEGKGHLTLTPDLNFVYAENLARLDHAAYLERLLAVQPGPVVVWSRPVEPGFCRWLWSRAWTALVGLGALVLAWIWKGWPRFGPLLPEPAPQRRSLLEHLAASAHLIWRGGAEAHLVAATRTALERRALTRNPAYGDLDRNDRALWLAARSGGDPDTIASALDDRPGCTPQALAQALHTLERLRQLL